jgi:hypothetical protein
MTHDFKFRNLKGSKLPEEGVLPLVTLSFALYFQARSRQRSELKQAVTSPKYQINKLPRENVIIHSSDISL